MAFGDTGGAVTELIITCTTPSSGDVDIAKGDVVALSSDYTVSHPADAEAVIFGQAMAAAADNDMAIPVKVRGICIFDYTGTAPTVDGAQGVLASATSGKVKAPASGNCIGVNVKADTANTQVHVLL